MTLADAKGAPGAVLGQIASGLQLVHLVNQEHQALRVASMPPMTPRQNWKCSGSERQPTSSGAGSSIMPKVEDLDFGLDAFS